MVELSIDELSGLMAASFVVGTLFAMIVVRAARSAEKSNKTHLSRTDLLAITLNWEQTSDRKSELIEKKIARTATRAELKELGRLKDLTEERGELFSPLRLPENWGAE